MGKMKELFMRQNYPNEDYDLEREYLINDSLAKDWEYEEFLKLQKDTAVNASNTLNTKIEIANEPETRTRTRIEVHQEEYKLNQQTKI